MCLALIQIKEYPVANHTHSKEKALPKIAGRPYPLGVLDFDKKLSSFLETAKLDTEVLIADFDGISGGKTNVEAFLIRFGQDMMPLVQVQKSVANMGLKLSWPYHLATFAGKYRSLLEKLLKNGRQLLALGDLIPAGSDHFTMTTNSSSNICMALELVKSKVSVGVTFCDYIGKSTLVLAHRNLPMKVD